MEYNKDFFEKLFSAARMKKYFALYPHDESKAITHYECNIILSESFYPCMTVLEVALRNAIARELQSFTHRIDWYNVFAAYPGLGDLNKYISQARKTIAARDEMENPDKITAELTLGFWTSLLNRNYERILWKHLRLAFPFMPKKIRLRKVIAAYLNRFRHIRNRIDHNEPICWNISKAVELHDDMVMAMGWINNNLPAWEANIYNFESVLGEVKNRMGLTSHT